jgi:small neutral amino acid transporter SnatA (MarC family)
MHNTGFLSWIFVTLITLQPIINPVSTAFILLGISTHLSEKEWNSQKDLIKLI